MPKEDAIKAITEALEGWDRRFDRAETLAEIIYDILVPQSPTAGQDVRK